MIVKTSAMATLTGMFAAANATEVVSSRSDTFIFEAVPNGEFSKSDFLAVSKVKKERAITYLPFEFDGAALGICPERDKIITATLTLFVKKIPLIPDSNAINADKNRGDNRDDMAPPAPSEIVAETADYAAEKIESLSENIIRIEVFGIVDDETFEPNTKNYRVSWDGNTDSIAPKHNTLDDKLDAAGIAKLGEIEIDLSKEEYDDGDRIEFKSEELTDFVSFCYGCTIAQNRRPKFQTSLTKIRYATIILRQESGPTGVFFYASDSFGEESDKAESGDEIKEKEEEKKQVDINGNVTAENPQTPSPETPSAEKLPTDAALPRQAATPAATPQTPAVPLESQTAQVQNPAANAAAAPLDAMPGAAEGETPHHTVLTPISPIPSAAGSAKKGNALENFAAEQSNLEKENAEAAKTSEEKEAEKKGNQTDNEEKKADLRPRIDFEFRSENIEQNNPSE